MILSKDEAICTILEFSKDNIITSPTKLNKLLARLNLDFIPIDIDFTLNKYGSYNAELADLNENKYFKVEPYILKTGVNSKKFILKPEGKIFFLNSVKPKLDKILTKEDFEILQNKIRELSDMRANEISDNEHKKLLVDTEDRFKLEQKVNVVYCDMYDLYEISKSLPENTLVDISLKALIEYCYHLIKFIKEIRFKHIPEGYDYEGYMFDYYFINNINEIIPFLKQQIKDVKKDKIRINKYYQYFVNSVSERNYPFSLDNPNLNKLLAS